MNISELARILRISPQELKNLLPEFGFSIGKKAIKVDNNTAKKIIKEWPRLKKEWDNKKIAEEKQKAIEDLPKEKKIIEVPKSVSVRDYADLAGIPVNRVLTELMKNGVFASINEKIDFDTAMIVGENLNLEVKEAGNILDEDDKEEKKLESILEKEEKGNLEERPPVIVVMGHVDHGKTKLLDTIRSTDVIGGEAGGITQHIGAYQINRKNKKLTFIDTPGHEAFTAMRSRGAKVADIAILVVAADDGVKQQTVEAFQIIKAAKIPYLVAINKVDKETADVNRVKQELSTELNIVPEDWGGKTICANISALKKEGIEEMLDMILLLSETESENLYANPNASAAGTVIESNVDKEVGPLATILVQNGTLRVGDQLCFNNIIYGKVKSLKDYNGEEITEAGPSMPAKVLGLKIAPSIGDILTVGEGEKVKANKIKSRNNRNHSIYNTSSEEAADSDVSKFNIIIKADFLGSAEAIEESLMKINNEKVKVKILSRGLGYITEGDVKRAEDSEAQILGFNVKIPPAVETQIREKQVVVKTFSVIYDLIKYAKEQMQLLIKPEINRIDLGSLKVLAIFRTENDNQIVGGKVIEGIAKNNTFVEVIRDDNFITLGKITQLQSAKQDVKEVEKGIECGVKFEGKPIIEEGDILKFYEEEQIIGKL
jgi:translation initiation factor IF-2